MFEIFKAILLGIVEGVTEFLPISSTGHLILIQRWISFDNEFNKIFDVFIQLGAILAVVVLFRDRLWPFGKTPYSKEETFDIWKKTIFGVIPAIILGALFGDELQDRFFNSNVVSTALIFGGVLLIWIERKNHSQLIQSVRQIGYGKIFLISLAQCVAMIPGTSRSAATIIGAMLLGVSRSAATEYSFFLAIPTMTAAATYSLFKGNFLFDGNEIIVLLVGFVSAFLVAWVVVSKFIGYVAHHNFRWFGYYRIILGLIVFLFFWN